MGAILRRILVVAILLLAGCTQIYFKRFEVAPEDRSYPARAQFEDIRNHVRERGFRVMEDERDYARFELATNWGTNSPSAPSDYLEIKLLPQDKVELVLVRISSGPDYSDAQVKTFQQTLQTRIRERTGKLITVRFVSEQKGLKEQR